jgi:hypothetical protein
MTSGNTVDKTVVTYQVTSLPRLTPNVYRKQMLHGMIGPIEHLKYTTTHYVFKK